MRVDAIFPPAFRLSTRPAIPLVPVVFEEIFCSTLHVPGPPPISSGTSFPSSSFLQNSGPLFDCLRPLGEP